jgi:hypothetical protein
MPAHSSASGTDLHEDKRLKEPVRAASTANVVIATPGSTLDGVTLNSGDRILLKNQSTVSQNGPYTWSGSASALVRTPDADSAADFVHGFLTYVREGTANGATYWLYTTATTPITLGSTGLVFAPFAVGSGTVTSVALTVPSEFSVSGSPVTASGTLAVSKATQSANTIFAGPTTGGAAVPTFRAAVAADLPLFGASGASHSAGAVSDPGASAGTTRFLREDNTFQVPPGTGSGSTSSGGGGSGALVPMMVIGPLTATQATLPFSGIAATGYRNLRLRVKARSTVGASNATLGIQANSDTGSNYAYEVVADASGGLNRLSSASSLAAVLAYVPGGTAPAGAAAVLDIAIPNYTDALQKSFSATGGFEQSTSAGDQFTQIGTGFWRSTAAISTLTVILSSGSFEVGSYACLYGEMDTAGPLLTPASNLIQDTILLTTASSIAIPNIPQNYRDLIIEVQGRGDTASGGLSLAVDVGFRANGDTGSNYDWTNQVEFLGGIAGYEAIAATTGFVSKLPAAGATALMSGSFRCIIPNYAVDTGLHKGFASTGETRVGTGANNQYATTGSVRWRSTVPITSLELRPAAGLFVAGTTVRVYGEPVSAGGSANGTGTRLRISSNLSLTDATDTIVGFDTEDSDADNQHFTSAANLTGTVSKTATTTQALAGSGTAFLTELSVGQVISVPGTAVEKRVITAIASNTSLTVNAPFANSASGQTAVRVNSAIVFRQPGFSDAKAGGYFASNATGFRKLAIVLNDTTVIAQADIPSIGATAMGVQAVASQQFQQWDFVEVQVRQNSGGALNLTADQRTFFSSSTARPTVIVAVPYVCIKDSEGAEYGGWHVHEQAPIGRATCKRSTQIAAGILCPWSSNQFTIPGRHVPSSRSRCPVLSGCVAHQAFLYNVTDSAEVKRGSSGFAATGAGLDNSVITGRMTISATKALEVRHRGAVTISSNGFGVEANFGAEVYTVVELWKEG